MSFGERLRALRLEAKMSQCELAAVGGVHFTYQSKIENDRIAPPSERVIQRQARELARRLGLDETALADALTTAAGKVPSDLAAVLAQNPRLLQFLRRARPLCPDRISWPEM